MKILFITGGLTSLRGKSNSYQETVIDQIVARGHEVTLLCLAEVSPFPWMHWKKTVEKFPIYHLYNGGIYPGVYPQGGVGTRSPHLEIKPSQKLRKTVLEIIAEVAPDLISFQSLFGLPLELLQEIAQGEIPTHFTALDYFSLCPTAHLFPPDQKPCRLGAKELTCHECCQETLHYPTFWMTHWINLWIDSLAPQSFFQTTLCRFRNLLLRLNRFWNRDQIPSPFYSQRREAAIQALRSLTVIHCISQHQADLFHQLAGTLSNLQVLHAHPASTQKIDPQIRLNLNSAVEAVFTSLPPFTQRVSPIWRGTGSVPPGTGKAVSHCPSILTAEFRLKKSRERLKFIALNVHAPYKGAELLHTTFTQLQQEGFPFELHFYGATPQQTVDSPHFFYHGRYQESDLDRIAAEADFCLIPSLWDETLGFVGLEMISRGVPLIVSDRAGVREFVQDRENGLIFNPTNSDSLLITVREVFQNKSLCDKLWHNIALNNPALKTFDEHVDEIEQLFLKLKK